MMRRLWLFSFTVLLLSSVPAHAGKVVTLAETPDLPPIDLPNVLTERTVLKDPGTGIYDLRQVVGWVYWQDPTDKRYKKFIPLTPPSAQLKAVPVSDNPLYSAKINKDMEVDGRYLFLQAKLGAEQIAEFTIKDATAVAYDANEVPCRQFRALADIGSHRLIWVNGATLTIVAKRIFQKLSGEATANAVVFTAGAGIYSSTDTTSFDPSVSVDYVDINNYKDFDCSSFNPLLSTLARERAGTAPRARVLDILVD